jgi:hypothetical protein
MAHTESARRWARVGPEVLVLDAEQTVVRRFRGEHADAAELLMDDPTAVVPAHLRAAADELAALGVLPAAPVGVPQLSRRRVLIGGAVVAGGAGVVSVGLPTAAAAASEVVVEGLVAEPAGAEGQDVQTIVLAEPDNDTNGDVVLTWTDPT